MAKRLGSGEYESVDVEVRQSTIEARYLFLKALKAKRSFWAYDLLGLFKYDERLKEFLENDKVDFTIHFFLSYLLNKIPRKVEISPEIIDTPLINYYWFFFDKENEIKRLESDEDTQRRFEFDDSIKRRNHALKTIIPNWKELQIRTDAKALCTSLQNWAKKYNLNEDWCLDFALGILRVFKSEFDFKLLAMEKDISLREPHSCRITYELEVMDTISKATADYWSNEVWINKWSGFDDLEEFPAFEYRLRDFKLPPLTWLARMSSRKGFVKEMQDKLQEQVEYLRHSNQLWSYSNEKELNHLLENWRKHLESYCDYIEQQKSKNIDENFFPPVDFETIGKTVWFPSKQIREQFVEETLAELKTRLERNHKALKSYEYFTKSHFEAALTEYCNKIEKALPKDWVRTPLKYSEEIHFEWLIDYQITPCKSFTQIAEENNVDRKTVSEAVKKLAEVVGISLHGTIITGRPKGSKDSKDSNRQRGIFKN